MYNIKKLDYKNNQIFATYKGYITPPRDTLPRPCPTPPRKMNLLFSIFRVYTKQFIFVIYKVSFMITSYDFMGKKGERERERERDLKFYLKILP